MHAAAAAGVLLKYCITDSVVKTRPWTSSIGQAMRKAFQLPPAADTGTGPVFQRMGPVRQWLLQLSVHGNGLHVLTAAW